MLETAVRKARIPLLCSLLVVLGLLACYWTTLQEILAVWDGSETYQHGYAVPPLCAWLIWRERAQLFARGFTPGWFAIPVLLLAGLGWLVGELAAVGTVKHFALVGLLLAAVWLVWGTRATFSIAFPLCFLFFAVPFGEFLVPVLMQYTADFTVMALRVTGIPVYREGLSFVIPSGNWSVVEACSGIRYLIASVMVGALYAYLTYTSLTRRLVFVAVAFMMPLLANWLRAYMIVMIGHLSGNTLAVGVDHLIYGWAFFGVVIFGMFWVGARWRQDPPVLSAPPPGPVASASAFVAASLVALVLGSAWQGLAHWLLDAPVPQVAVLQAPAGEGGWMRHNEPVFGGWAPVYSGAAREMTQTYRKGADTLQLHVFAYAGQGNGRKLVQWNNTLVTAEGGRRWQVLREKQEELVLGTHSLPTRFAVIKGAAELSVWSWLRVDQREITSDREAKLSLLMDRLTRRSDYSAAVFISSDAPEARARGLVVDFLQANLAGINTMLDRAVE